MMLIINLLVCSKDDMRRKRLDRLRHRNSIKLSRKQEKLRYKEDINEEKEAYKRSLDELKNSYKVKR